MLEQVVVVNAFCSASGGHISSGLLRQRQPLGEHLAVIDSLGAFHPPCS